MIGGLCVPVEAFTGGLGVSRGIIVGDGAIGAINVGGDGEVVLGAINDEDDEEGVAAAGSTGVTNEKRDADNGTI